MFPPFGREKVLYGKVRSTLYTYNNGIVISDKNYYFDTCCTFYANNFHKRMIKVRVSDNDQLITSNGVSKMKFRVLMLRGNTPQVYNLCRFLHLPYITRLLVCPLNHKRLQGKFKSNMNC